MATISKRSNRDYVRHLETIEKLLEEGGGGGGTPNAVKYTAQSLTSSQQQQARTNIGSASASELSQKQDTLVSGTNIKTLNNQSLLGSGNITIDDQSAVKYTEAQSLSNAQKATARGNIAAASLADINNTQYVKAAIRPEPSENTVGPIYLIGPDANDEYERYFTQESNGTYTWVALGSTEIHMDGYATDQDIEDVNSEISYLQQEVTADISQLEHKVDEYVETITSNEYTELLLDEDDKILESRDANGDKTFNCGVTFNGGVNGLPIPAIADNLTTDDATETLSAKQGYVLEGKKVDKTALAELIEPIESSSYSEVLVDADDKLLESRDENGKKTIYTDVHIKGEVTGDKLPEIVVKPGLDFVDAVIDASDKMVEGTTKDGKKVFFGGIATEDGTTFKPSPLFGKKWVVLGDSFTNGSADNGTISEDGKYKGSRCVYPYIVANRTGLDVVKFFEGGQTLAFPALPGDFTNSVTCPTNANYYQNIPADADIITVYLGINDSHHAPGREGGDGEDNTGEIPIGTITDNTTATYYGAWNVILSWLIENRPFAHIGIIVSNGCDTADYRTAQIAIARKYGIPFIDLNGDDRTPFMIRSQNTDIPSAIRAIRTEAQALDYPLNTHPNRDAHIFESTFIENFLKSL